MKKLILLLLGGFILLLSPPPVEAKKIDSSPGYAFCIPAHQELVYLNVEPAVVETLELQYTALSIENISIYSPLFAWLVEDPGSNSEFKFTHKNEFQNVAISASEKWRIRDCGIKIKSNLRLGKFGPQTIRKL